MVRILIDGDKYQKICQQYKVRGYPSMLYLDSEGKEVDKMAGRDTDSILSQINDVLKKYGRGPKWMESADKALEAGKKERKAVVLYFTDEDEKSAMWVKVLFCHSSIKQDLVDKCVYAKVPFKKDDPFCVKWNVKESRAVVFIDNTGDAPKEIKRLSKSSKGPDAKSALEACLKALPAEEKK